jgi:hypothetical protein
MLKLTLLGPTSPLCVCDLATKSLLLSRFIKVYFIAIPTGKVLGAIVPNAQDLSSPVVSMLTEYSYAFL